MIEIIREAFERETATTFGVTSKETVARYTTGGNKGQYKNPNVEDHWQTFQEGWEAAVKHLKNKKNESFSDIMAVSGDFDPRN